MILDMLRFGLQNGSTSASFWKGSPVKRFHNILFVSQGLTDESDALKQALSIARNNSAKLRALIVCPALPKELAGYVNVYQNGLIDQLNKCLQATREIVNVCEATVPVHIEIDSGPMPAMRMIRHVLNNEHDLLIKEAEPLEDRKGFKALDMELLRKCPCPVWMCRPIHNPRHQMKVSVAIDPENADPQARGLSVRLLQLARSLADTCNGRLNIISCWDYEMEAYLRQNAWVKMGPNEVTGVVNNTRQEHRNALESILVESKIGGEYHVYQMRGKADEQIPKHVDGRDIDILVMGTVARTGIMGLVIGNTAENILQKLQCSLVALKPDGFQTTVR